MKTSVIIPSFHRAQDLKVVLKCLCDQSLRDFNVNVVLKPSGDGSEEVLDSFRKLLDLNVIFQTKGTFLDGLNLGLEKGKGDIFVFLDDDVTFEADLLKSHVLAYSRGIGGISGQVLPHGASASKIFSSIVYRPLPGHENFAYWVTRSGHILHNNLDKKQDSILGAGANFSVLASAVKKFRFKVDGYWRRGTGNESVLSQHVLKQGYRIIYDPKIIVNHPTHMSLSRDLENKSLWIERSLLFYRLREIGYPVSTSYRIAFLAYDFGKDLIQGSVKMLPTKVLAELLGFTRTYRKSQLIESKPKN